MISQDAIPDLTIFSKDNYYDFISQYPNKINSIEAHLLSQKSDTWVSNINTDIIIISHKEPLWTATASINHKEYKNAFVCSPHATYIEYPLEMMKKFNKNWIKALILFNAYFTGPLCRATKIDQVVQIDNNLYSLLKHSEQLVPLLPKLTKFISEKFKDHAIVFFRVNEQLDKQLLDVLKANGYIVFPDRTSHIFYPHNDYLKHHNTQRDLSLLDKTNYKIISHDEITEQDINRLSQLYQMLFIDKHSKFNPIYTDEFFRQSIKNRWYEYKALRHSNGRIDAYISWFYRENIMICGPIGYDITVNKRVGLYRMIMALSLQHAYETQSIFNIGTGSDQFKLNRGSTKTFEYTAVYCEHLPFYRHIPWRLLSKMYNALIKRIFQKYSL